MPSSNHHKDLDRDRRRRVTAEGKPSATERIEGSRRSRTAPMPPLVTRSPAWELHRAARKVPVTSPRGIATKGPGISHHRSATTVEPLFIVTSTDHHP